MRVTPLALGLIIIALFSISVLAAGMIGTPSISPLSSSRPTVEDELTCTWVPGSNAQEQNISWYRNNILYSGPTPSEKNTPLTNMKDSPLKKDLSSPKPESKNPFHKLLPKRFVESSTTHDPWTKCSEKKKASESMFSSWNRDDEKHSSTTITKSDFVFDTTKSSSTKKKHSTTKDSKDKRKTKEKSSLTTKKLPLSKKKASAKPAKKGSKKAPGTKVVKR